MAGARVTTGGDWLTWVLGMDRGLATGGMLALKHPGTSPAPALERLHSKRHIRYRVGSRGPVKETLECWANGERGDTQIRTVKVYMID